MEILIIIGILVLSIINFVIWYRDRKKSKSGGLINLLGGTLCLFSVVRLTLEYNGITLDQKIYSGIFMSTMLVFNIVMLYKYRDGLSIFLAFVTFMCFLYLLLS